MNYPDLAIAIDIGSSKICAIAGSADDQSNGVNIEAFAERSFKLQETAVQNGKIVNLEKTAELVDEVLIDIAQQLVCQVDTISLSISSNDILGQVYKTAITRSEANTTVQDEDVSNLLSDVRRSFKSFPGHTLLHTLPQSFTVDERVVNDDPVGNIGVRLGGSFYNITVPVEELRHLRNCIDIIPPKAPNGSDLKNAYFTIESVLFSPVANAMGLLQLRDRDGIAIVDIGSDTTDLIVFSRQGVQHTAVIPIAGKTITEDIANAYNLTIEDAEMLKLTCTAIPRADMGPDDVMEVEIGDGLPKCEVPFVGVKDIIELRLREIAAIVATELTKHKLETRLPRGIILVGGGVNGHDIGTDSQLVAEIFSDMLDLKARIGNPLKNIKRNSFSNLSNPRYATVVGLLVAAFNDFDGRVPRTILDPDWGPIQPSSKTAGKSKIATSTTYIEPINTGSPVRDIINKLKRIIGDSSDRNSY